MSETLEQLMGWAKESKPVLIEKMPMEQYHDLGNYAKHGKDFVIGKSMLAEMDCPAKFKYKYIDGNLGDSNKPHFNIGTAAHTLALEPDLFLERFYLLPEGNDARKKVGKDEIANAERDGRIPLKRNDFLDVQGMASAISSDDAARLLLQTKGPVESTLIWTDKKTGLKLKTRPDFLRDDGVCVDLKTTTSTHPNDFCRSSYDFHYDMSVAMTFEGYQAVFEKPLNDYVFLAVEKTAPYIVMAYDSFRSWDKEDMSQTTYFDVGRMRFRNALDRLAECLNTGVWPKYLNGIHPMSVPAYEMKKLEGISNE